MASRAFLLLASLLIAWQASAADGASPAVPGEGDERLLPIAQRAASAEGIPAAGVMVVDRDGPVAIAVAGVRRNGGDEPVQLGDQWHLGSLTKAMTATLLAILAEDGALPFDATMEQAFPGVASMRDEWRAVTIPHLLAHHGGAVENMPWALMPPAPSMEQRRALAAAAMLALPPSHPPGSAVYSNAGYMLAGAAAEAATGRAWEDLMRERVFAPLGMAGAGFGGTGTPGLVDQPWPHHEGGRPAASNGPGTDNAPIIGPAGTIHAPLADYGAFIAEHLRAGNGEGPLLPPGAFERLHTPPFDDLHALGWIAVERSWGGGTVLTHTGSNTMNFAVVWMAPQKGLAFVAVVNTGGEEAARACDRMTVEASVEFLGGGRP